MTDRRAPRTPPAHPKTKGAAMNTSYPPSTRQGVTHDHH